MSSSEEKLNESKKNSYLDMINSVVKANYNNVYCVKALKEAFSEVVELNNDIIDCWGEVPREIFVELVFRSAFLLKIGII